MWFPYAVLTAIFSAVSVIYTKYALKHVNASVMTLALSTLNLPFLILLALIGYKPLSLAPIFFLAAIGSGILFILSKTLSLSAIKGSQLSQVIPLTSLSVFATYLFGVLILNEQIAGQGVAGLLLISTGTYVLNADHVKTSLLEPVKMLVRQRNPRIYILATLIGSLISMFDKTALNQMEPVSPVILLIAQNIVISIGMLAFLQIRKPDWQIQYTQNLGRLLIASLIYGAFVLFAFSGFSQGPVAFTVALMNTRTLIILAMSYVLYKDKPTKSVLIGTIITLIGVICIKSS